MNKDIAEAFAARFTPPLNVVATQRVNGMPVKNGFMCAYHDQARSIGVTFVVFGPGVVHAFLEATAVHAHEDVDVVEDMADAIIAGLHKYEMVTAIPQIGGAKEEQEAR